MEHDITVEGLAYRLRPVEIEDASFIVGLRTDPDLGRYVGPTSSSVPAQKEWIRRYLRRPGDFYFVVERRSGAREGTLGLYGLQLGVDGTSAEWGRWLLSKGSWAAVESAALLYEVAFERLLLHSVFCRTMVANQKVVSFHTSFGLPIVGVEPASDGGDLVRHELQRWHWLELRPQIERRVCAAATFALR